MALAASLQLRQNQSLVMTPQLVQSIRLLQLPHAELLRFVEAEIERNPLLEYAAEEDSAAPNGSAGDSQAVAPPPGAEDNGWFEKAGAPHQEPLDDGYENVFPDNEPPKADAPELISQWKSMPGAASTGSGSFDVDDFVAGTESLRDHVARQIALTPFTAAERLIAAELADQLDEAGYLKADLATCSAQLNVSQTVLNGVLLRLQQLEPTGIFARSLAECLEIQLRERDRFDPAMATLTGHLDLLARRDFRTLKRLCGVDESDLLDMLAEIRALDPKPGNRFQSGYTQQSIVADILVSPSPDGGWHVEVNPETLPRVLVNRSYYAAVSQPAAERGDGDHDFLGTCLQNANWLTRSLDQRARTILKVAQEIVRRQDQFLVHGVTCLKPLNLKTVAEAIGMHESTVSRVTSNKYMLTPRGIFELKAFFTVSIASTAGEAAHSAAAVRHLIRAMISEEEAHAVLSDDAIVAKLRASGIDIARRTIAKYREEMNIPSSVQRRREKRTLALAQGASRRTVQPDCE